MEIFKLFGSILINSDQADQSLQRTDDQASRVGNTLGKSIGTAAKWGIGLATAATGVGAGLFAMAEKASGAAALIDDISQRTNISSKTLQELKYAAEMSGIGIENIEGSAKKLTVTMGKYAEGNKGTIEAFKELGLSALDAKGGLKSTDEMFPQILAKLADMENITERNNLAVKIFGKSAMDMAPMLNGGSEGLKQLTDEAHKLGLVMSDESVKAGAQFDDTFTQVKSTITALGTNIGLSLVPIAQSMMNWFMTNMPTIQAVAGTAFNIISSVVSVLGNIISNVLMVAFNALSAWIQPNIPMIQSIMQIAFDAIKLLIEGVSIAINSVVDWCVKFKDILTPLATGLAVAGTAFGVYTLAVQAHTLATTLATTATTAFGTVMTFITSPIGIVVVAITGLVAAFVLAYNNIEGFRNIVDSVWSFIVTKTKEVFENYILPFIKNILVPAFKTYFKIIGEVVKAAFVVIEAAWNYVLKPLFTALMFYVQNVMIPAWKLAFSIVGGAVSSAFNTISDLWNKSVKPIFNGIIDFVTGAFTGNWKKAWQGVTSTFKGVWEGMKAIAKAPINFIIGGLNGFIDGINKIQIPDWVPGVGGKGINIPRIPSFEVGTRYLPDDMLIQAHKGEMIVPKSENPYANSGGSVLPKGGDLVLKIENFYNNTKQDIEELAQELDYYRNKTTLATGGN